MPAVSIARPAIAALVLLAAAALTGAVLSVWWPGGVAIGLAVGAGSMLAIGTRMQRSNLAVPVDEALEQRLGVAVRAPVAPVAVPAVAPLTARPDDAFFSSTAGEAPAAEPADLPAVIPSTDFVLTDDDDARVDGVPVGTDVEAPKVEFGDDELARAARLVVATQYASAARLQRDLAVPRSRARRLLSDLEERHFVGPATGSLPRVVLMPKDRLPEVERLLAEA